MAMTDEQPGFFAELKRRKVSRVAVAYIVVAWVALQFLDLVLENLNAPDWVMQAVMALFAIGLPVALVLAWAFDITDEGIKATGGSNRRFTVMVALVSILAIGFAAWSFLDTEPTSEVVAEHESAEEIRPIDSIAVLPFESFSENRSDEYFADGLADTLLHKLAQLPNLKVIARNSSFQFKGTNKDTREIGEILDVAALLEGSVQRQGDQVRVIAQLIDTADGTHIWSATFDDTMQNIFELQDRLAGEIMVQLQISISEQDRRRVLRNGTSSPEAYDLLMRANELHWNPGREVFNPESDPALELIDRALEIDPDYAQAWATRSSVFSSVLFFDFDTSRSVEYIERAREAAERAIEADPGFAEGYVRLAWSYFRARDYVEAERHLVKALQLDPNNAGALSSLGLVKNDDDPQMALDLFTRARELDPESSFVYRQLSFALRALGRLDEAEAVLREGVERFPEHPVLLDEVTGINLDTRGRPDEAARWATRIVGSDSQNFIGPSTMSEIWSAVGDNDRSRDWLAVFAARFEGSQRVNLTRYAIEMRSGDPATARDIIEGTPESPNFRFDRSIRIGGACLVLGDAVCMKEHAGRMQAWLDEFAARGQAYAPRVRYELAIAVLNNAAIEDAADRDVETLQSLLDLTADWPITGGRGSRNVDYFRAMLQSLLGNDEAAVEELRTTLQLDSGGFVHRDIFHMPPEMNPVIARLAGLPGYAEWQAALNGRREGARANLVRMEESGEILSADDVAP
jgi:TolB-like protein/Tfp pilus assembly protein PilF